MYIQCFAIYPIISLLVGDRQTDSHTQILEMLLHLKTSFISPESYNTVSSTKTIIRLLTIISSSRARNKMMLRNIFEQPVLY